MNRTKKDEEQSTLGDAQMQRKGPKMGANAYLRESGNVCPPSKRINTVSEFLQTKQPNMGCQSDLWSKKNHRHSTTPRDMTPAVEVLKTGSATGNKIDSGLVRARHSLHVVPLTKKPQGKHMQDAVDSCKETIKATKGINELKTTSKRKSLPNTAVSKVKKEFRRMSGKFMSVKEESGKVVCSDDDEAQYRSPPREWAKQRLILVQDGVLRIADQFDVPMVYFGDEQNIKHLIYGEGYSGFENCEGFPNELFSVLAKTPSLETLELRGFWDLTTIPIDFFKCIMRFPRLSNLQKLVLPEEGRFLDRMGSILLGIFGSQLKSLECPGTFLEGCCVQDLSMLVPNLKHFKISDKAAGDGILDTLLEDTTSSSELEKYFCRKS